MSRPFQRLGFIQPKAQDRTNRPFSRLGFIHPQAQGRKIRLFWRLGFFLFFIRIIRVKKNILLGLLGFFLFFIRVVREKTLGEESITTLIGRKSSPKDQDIWYGQKYRKISSPLCHQGDDPKGKKGRENIRVIRKSSPEV